MSKKIKKILKGAGSVAAMAGVVGGVSIVLNQSAPEETASTTRTIEVAKNSVKSLEHTWSSTVYVVPTNLWIDIEASNIYSWEQNDQGQSIILSGTTADHETVYGRNDVELPQTNTITTSKVTNFGQGVNINDLAHFGVGSRFAVANGNDKDYLQYNFERGDIENALSDMDLINSDVNVKNISFDIINTFKWSQPTLVHKGYSMQQELIVNSIDVEITPLQTNNVVERVNLDNPIKVKGGHHAWTGPNKAERMEYKVTDASIKGDYDKNDEIGSQHPSPKWKGTLGTVVSNGDWTFYNQVFNPASGAEVSKAESLDFKIDWVLLNRYEMNGTTRHSGEGVDSFSFDIESLDIMGLLEGQTEGSLEGKKVEIKAMNVDIQVNFDTSETPWWTGFGLEVSATLSSIDLLISPA